MIGEAPRTYTLAGMLDGMDKALADEIKAQSTDESAAYTAIDGKLIAEESQRYIYEFSLKDPWEPNDDTPVKVKIAGAPLIKGTIVTSTGTAITIATEVELSAEELRQIKLVNDATELLERLREALKNTNEGSPQLGSKAFGLCKFTSEIRSTYIKSGIFHPDPSQKQAIEKTLGSEVMYLIGPPGTGKTSTLAEMAFTHLREGRTVLIAAHTNIAVDNAIMKLVEICQEAKVLTELHSSQIVRYGTPQDRRLMDDDRYEDVYIPKIAKRIGSDLHQQSEQLKLLLQQAMGKLAVMKQTQEEGESQQEWELESINQRCEALRDDMANLQAREQQRRSSLDTQLSNVGRLWNQAYQKATTIQQELQRMVAQQVQLQSAQLQRQTTVQFFSSRLSEAQQMNAIKRLFKGIDPKQIEQQLVEVKHQLWQDGQQLAKLQAHIDVAHHSYEAAMQETKQLSTNYNTVKVAMDTPSDDAKQIDRLRLALAQYEERARILDANIKRAYSDNEQQYRQLEDQRIQLEAQIAVIDRQLAELEKNIVVQARVVATTLSKIYMNQSLSERRFDVVILDEVSMAPLPAVYVAASRAEQSVVAIGDPRQLAPIKRAKTVRAEAWLGTDLFVHRGITLEAADDGRIGSSQLLKEQSRMHPDISVIARKYVYNGRVEDKAGRTAEKWKPYAEVAPLPGQSLLLCDTSDASPFATKPAGGSRINMYHALCAIALARQVLASLPVPDPVHGNTHRIGLVTPYTKQAELLQQLIRDAELKDLVRAGTVHKFQGLEFDAVIFDTVDSSPLRKAENFIGGSSGMRLINVAVTRPRHKLIIVANASYIRSSFREEDTMLLAVEEARKAGVLLSKNVLNIPTQPLSKTLQRLLPEKDYERLRKSGLPADQYQYKLLNETVFFPIFLEDVQKAKKEVVIFSPYLAPQRTSQVLPALLDRIRAGVRVTVRTKPTDESNETAGKAEFLLRNSQVDVKNDSGMHEKLVIIDEEIVYIGSLNVLSHNNTSETMLRVQSSELAKTALKIRETSQASKGFRARATPPESGMQGPDVLVQRKELLKDYCGTCGDPLIAKPRKVDGKFFLGCGNYPTCRYTSNITEKHLINVPQLQNRHCEKCGEGVSMQVRVYDKDLRLECAAPTPCGYWQSIVIL